MASQPQLPTHGPAEARLELHVGGAGWTGEQAEQACLGEALERCAQRPGGNDRIAEGSFTDWPLDEPAIEPVTRILPELRARIFRPISCSSQVVPVTLV